MDINYLERCTYAIISHPDAGKTTMTEKLLWFGGVIHKTGMVKSKTGNYATSDWMELEKQRGISITSSVMSFQYLHRMMHLLDTPGHKDFSEDTYRTLTAVESVLMMIDSAKGVEAQTIKLMEVCRLRDTPIATFMNKFDRESMDPFALLENVEKICSIQCCPITWPIGSGSDFKGVINIKTRQILSFENSKDPLSPTYIDASDLDNPTLVPLLGAENIQKLKEDLEFITSSISPFQKEEYLAGIQTPVFFGTALYNFGVKDILDFIANEAPGPLEREAVLPPYELDSPRRMVEPEEKNFSGFVFKIQANMDKKHRDRMSFLRITSGEFKRGDKVTLVREDKELKISNPVFFISRDREIVEEAKAGDIIGINGSFQIGDTFTSGEKFQFRGIPSFAPEIFMRVILKDPLKAKHLDKGLQQLSEEGAVQLFYRSFNNERILGAVGMLQFDVVKFRLLDEYKVHGDYSPINFKGIRWPTFPNKNREREFIENYSSSILKDMKGRLCFAFSDDWDFKMAQEKNKDVKFYNNSDYRA